jgi:hypothetical protein
VLHIRPWETDLLAVWELPVLCAAVAAVGTDTSGGER